MKVSPLLWFLVTVVAVTVTITAFTSPSDLPDVAEKGFGAIGAVASFGIGFEYLRLPLKR